MSDIAARVFKHRGIDVDVKPGMDPQQLQACIGNYDALVIRSETKATADIIKAGTNLKVIGRAGIGVDNVDIPCATEYGVIVMNTPFGNAITTAEHAISMMLSLLRSIPQASLSTHQGKWEKSRFMGTEIYGKTLGIIGCGNIGSIVADRALGLKMKVLAYDPYLSAERATKLCVEKVELDELFSRADIVTLHTPLTNATRAIINKDSIAKMKPGVFIVNCARGGLIVEQDLKHAIENGHVAGAAIDVYEREPAKEHLFFGMDQVICTPHLGASTKEAQENVALQVAEQIADFLLTGSVANALNMPSLSAEDALKLKPYIKLCNQLGSLVGQIMTTELQGISIEYQGQAARLNTKPLTAVVLAGVFSSVLGSANMVNAPIIAKQRNISITEATKEQCQQFVTQIVVTVTTKDGAINVAGSLFGDTSPRIVNINDIPIEAELGKHMIYVTNSDNPGFIGRLGTTLGDMGINIATFNLGRKKQGDEAIALVQVDQPLESKVIDRITKLPDIHQAIVLGF